MFPQEIATTLTELFKQNYRSIVVFLQGPPGMGKTAVVGQASQAASKELRTFALPTCESVDLRGLPTVEKGARFGRSRFLAPDKACCCWMNYPAQHQMFKSLLTT
jgi:hypothetical protein